MTLINKEFTRQMEKTRTVSECDVCGLTELDIPDDETIDTIKSNPTKDITYVLYIIEYDGDEVVEEWRETFDTTNQGNTRINDLDDDCHDFSKSMDVSIEWDLKIDTCTNCQNMLFGATMDRNY